MGVRPEALVQRSGGALRLGEEGGMAASDKINNKARELKGKAKEAIGKATDNQRWRVEGQMEQVAAKFRGARQKVKHALRQRGRRPR
jgi:uncharacterized protein YjbJ (UPF0337 family)